MQDSEFLGKIVTYETNGNGFVTASLHCLAKRDVKSFLIDSGTHYCFIQDECYFFIWMIVMFDETQILL